MTSWTIRAVGTAEELRQQVHDHEVLRAADMDESSRLLAHHALGHAIGIAARHPERRYVLEGHGRDSAEVGNLRVDVFPE